MTRASPIIAGVDVSHDRLAELTKLADAAKPFHSWVEDHARALFGDGSLTTHLLHCTEPQIGKLFISCLEDTEAPPALFDGIGRQYKHPKACYYFFAWLTRDFAAQRLAPLISRAAAATSKPARDEVLVRVLARVFVLHRSALGTFDWTAIREVIIDRLEGSRRAIRGREREIVIRTALSLALQRARAETGRYGQYAAIRVPDSEIRVGTETFDVAVELLDKHGEVRARILVPVKTRETEGGGHSHIFTRDINSAIAASRSDKVPNWVATFIIAQNWSEREQTHVQEICDFAAWIQAAPGSVHTIDEQTQARFDEFVAEVLAGSKGPKGLGDGPRSR